MILSQFRKTSLFVIQLTATMKTLLFIALFTSTFAFIAADTSPNTTILPACGLQCIVSQVELSPCSLTNTTCICLNKQIAESASLCLSANCTIRDQLSTEKFSKETCGAPVNDRTKLVLVTALVGSALAILAFSLRIGARFIRGGGSFGLDDSCLGFAMLLNVPFTVFAVILSQHGLGKDIWEVSFDNITYVIYIYFWEEVIYVMIIPLTKISILFFYLRIFPDPGFRKITYTLIALHFTYCLIYVFLTIFECKPISGAWTRWDGTFQGTCFNLNAQIWSSAIVNIVLDIATLFLPLPSIYKLNLSPKRKLQILVMFSVGFFVTIVSILRMHTLGQFAYTTNITQDYVSIGYWSTIEAHVGIICACMPAIRQLFQHAFSNEPGSTIHRTTISNSMPKPGSFSSRFSGKSPTIPYSSSSFSQNLRKPSKQEDDSWSVHELMSIGVGS